MRKRRTLLGALALSALAACGGNSDTRPAESGSPAGSGAAVVLKDIAFKPEQITVEAGGSVTWRFEDKGIKHNVTADDGSFKSETTDSGTFSHTFEKAGTYSYKCTVHPDTMKGVVEVS